jgi:hypothetical protein
MLSGAFNTTYNLRIEFVDTLIRDARDHEREFCSAMLEMFAYFTRHNAYETCGNLVERTKVFTHYTLLAETEHTIELQSISTTVIHYTNAPEKAQLVLNKHTASNLTMSLREYNYFSLNESHVRIVSSTDPSPIRKMITTHMGAGMVVLILLTVSMLGTVLVMKCLRRRYRQNRINEQASLELSKFNISEDDEFGGVEDPFDFDKNGPNPNPIERSSSNDSMFTTSGQLDGDRIQV